MIDRFTKQWRFLSNFYPVEIQWEGMTFPTVEHAYQAAKTLSREAREMISRAESPGWAKRMGKGVRLREGWDEAKVDVMYQLVELKFKDETLQGLLLGTENEELVEGNHWGDQFWGQCPLGRGENWLGKILMRLREELGENPKHKYCHSQQDGDCDWEECPQSRDGEPYATGRSCPLYEWCRDV